MGKEGAVASGRWERRSLGRSEWQRPGGRWRTRRGWRRSWRRRGRDHSPAGRSGWMGHHLRARSLSTTSQLLLPISKMPRSRICPAAASGCSWDAHSAEGTAAAAGGASSSRPPSRAHTRPPRLLRGMAETLAKPESRIWGGL